MTSYSLERLSDSLRTARADTTTTRVLLEDLHFRGGFQDLLRSLLSRDGTAQQIADLSYKHPNGFDRFMLLDAGDDQPKVRLHIWWPDDNVPEQIHNHAWDFSSVVLTGALRFQTYQTALAGEAKVRYRSLPPQHARTGYRLRRMGSAALVCAFDALLREGAVYTLNHEVFHRVTNGSNDVTGTIIIHGPFLREYSDIMADEPIDQQQEIRVRHFTLPELRNRVEALLTAMEH